MIRVTEGERKVCRLNVLAAQVACDIYSKASDVKTSVLKHLFEH